MPLFESTSILGEARFHPLICTIENLFGRVMFAGWTVSGGWLGDAWFWRSKFAKLRVLIKEADIDAPRGGFQHGDSARRNLEVRSPRGFY